MMDISEEFQRALTEMVKYQSSGPGILPATVKTVNDALGTCDVEIDGLTIYDVRLRASVNGELSNFLVLPAIGSSVLVANVGNSATEFAVVSYSEVTSLEFVTGDTKVIADAAGIHLERAGKNLGNVLSALISQIQAITVPVTSAPGTSGVPVNAAAFDTIKTNLQTILS